MTSKINKEIVEELQHCFESQLSILKLVMKADFEGRLSELKILAMSACSTGSAICHLGNNPEYFFTEITMLARSFIEKETNFCYLLVCEEEEYQNFLLHPYYRMFHNFERHKFAGDLKLTLRFTGKDEIKKHPKVIDALQRFSDTNPRQKWSKKNIDEKIALINDKSKIKVEFFLMNTLTIYSNASEALHGSLYGCTFHLGFFEPGVDYKDPSVVTEKVLKGTALMFAQLSSMVAETTKLISSFHTIEDEIKDVEVLEQKAVILIKSIFEK